MLLCLVSAAVLVTGCTQPDLRVCYNPADNNGSCNRYHPAFRHCYPHRNSRYDPVRPEFSSTPATSAGTPAATLTDDRNENVRIKARNFAFDPSRITVPAGSQVTVEFENEDGAPHNVAFYTTPSLATTIYKGAIIDGPGKITYVFTAPAIPGTYFFRCDLHPSMQGQFIVT